MNNTDTQATSSTTSATKVNLGLTDYEYIDINFAVVSIKIVRHEPCFTLSMLTYYMLKYPLKCAPAGIAGSHFSGYLYNQ